MEHKFDGCYCYFHPDEVFVGVCPLCLYERLLVIAAKRCRRGGLSLYTSGGTGACKPSKPYMVVTKMFAVDYLIHRKNRKPKTTVNILEDHDDNDDVSPSQDDSFISIRFDDVNTSGAWEKEKEKDSKSIVEHVKLVGRWRKWIGHVFHLITSKKSTRHVGSGGRMTVKGGRWIKSLTRRKTSNV